MQTAGSNAIEATCCNDGFVLVSALWLMALIGLMVATVSANFAYSSKLSFARMQHSRNRVASEGIANLVAIQLQQMDSDIDIGRTIYCRYRDMVNARILISDHDGMIDLNSASPNLLQAGFVALGYKNDEADYLSERVLDYRDRDNITTNGLLEYEYYSNADSGYLPKNQTIATIFELDQLPTSNPIDIVAAAKIFTVGSKLDGIDVSKASNNLKAVFSRINTDNIARRKTRNNRYSIDLTVHHAKSNSVAGLKLRNIIHVELSSDTNDEKSGNSLFWQVPLDASTIAGQKENPSISFTVPCSMILER